MEPLSTTAAGSPGGPGGALATNGVQRGNSPAGSGLSTDEQRAKWREKARLAYERKKAARGAAPVPAPGVVGVSTPPVPSGPPAGQQSAPGGAVGVPAQAWNPDLLRPLFEQVLPAIERADVESLTARAAKLGEHVAREVAKGAAWNPAARATLLSQGPVVAAKWLERAGVAAENAPEVAVAVAVGGILVGRWLLTSKLDKIAAERAAAEKKTDAGGLVAG